jgi:hypothetical protein
VHGVWAGAAGRPLMGRGGCFLAIGVQAVDVLAICFLLPHILVSLQGEIGGKSEGGV